MSEWLSFGKNTEHPGALTVDIRPVADQVEDIRALSFPDNSFRGIECYHILEHLYPHEAIRAVQELHRVLKPQGVLKVATPDLIACAKALLAGDIRILENIFGLRPAEQNHRWGYTEKTLTALLESARFGDIVRVPSRIDPNEIRLEARVSEKAHVSNEIF